MRSENARIVISLTGEFVVISGIAMGIAVPLAWLLAHRWLHHFAYHADPGFLGFVLSSSGITLVAILATGIQAFISAHIKPVNNLKR